ncbi:winged helix-turn-helix domain-containing protein [Rhizobium johnstonii]|jgi:DNA-binding response OmpR family regulator|uniref:response regulator transcription factor n=1 Tax=Rhizobium TaxID=379 RepID=UPI00140FE4F3|nr:response regulator transcription factor [Rhizobium leguminosarum]QIO64066.1 response regulator transcription factor [Rhizobium leguminosarum bv. trifolii]
MQNVLLESSNPDRSLEIARFFERHLVNLTVSRAAGFEDDLSAYHAADAILLALESNISAMADYLSRLCSKVGSPVIVLADRPINESEKLQILESGAVDCLSPPFGYREVLARLRARVRRNAIMRSRLLAHNFRFDVFGLNSTTRELVNAKASERLPKKEYSLLMHFLRNSYTAITREELLDVVNKSNLDLNDRSIDSLVSRLRERLVDMGGKPELIRTIRGFGYALEVDVEFVPGEADLRYLVRR